MLLDTDVFIEILRAEPDALIWLTRQYPKPYLSGVSALEAAYGTQSSIELQKVRGVILQFETIWPEPSDVQFAVERLALVKLSHGLGSLDAITASIALRRNLQIVTFNTKHFGAIPGVRVVQPYVR